MGPPYHAAPGDKPNPDKYNLATLAAEYIESIKQPFLDKVAQVTNTMENKQPTWNGCLSQITDGGPNFNWQLGIDTVLQDEKGAGPAVLASRKYAWRFGAAVVPFAGISTIIVAVTPGVRIVVYSVAPVLAEGISVKDVPAFLETATGHRYFEAHGLAISLPVGAAAYVPSGKLISVLNTNTSADESVPEVAVAWAVPIFAVGHFRNLPTQTSQALRALNEEPVKSAEPRKVWSAKAEVFSKFVSLCQGG